MPNAIELIADERTRQISKGFDAEHDKSHPHYEFIQAAFAYLHSNASYWPWTDGFKPSLDIVKDYTKAASLLAALIDKIQLEREEGL